ncbi:MAG: ATP-binding protein [Bacteroidota bacterium]
MHRTFRAFIWAFFIAVTAFGQQAGDREFVLMPDQESYDTLQSYLYIFKENEGRPVDSSQLLTEEVNSLFKPFEKSMLTRQPAVFWGKITFRNETEADLNNWIFHTGEGNYIDVFVFDKTGNQVAHERTGQWLPARLKKIDKANREERVYLSIPKNETRRVFLRVETKAYRPPDFEIKLQREDFYKDWSYRTSYILDGIFLGFMGTMFFFNFFSFFPSRDRAYFYQSLFVLATTIFMFQDLGILSDAWLLRDHPMSHLVIVYSALAVINITYIQFIRYYTDLKNVFWKWDVFLKRMLYVNIGWWVMIIAGFLLTKSVYHCDRAWSILFGFQYLAILVLMIQLIQTKDKQVYFLAAPTIAFIIDVLANGISVLMNKGINMAMTQFLLEIMIILFFMGLAYRMRHLREEEQESLRLKDINELKNKLYTNITHEFRTPLTVIKGMADELKEQRVLPVNGLTKKALNAIRFNADRLLNLVNRLLGLAKIEAGQMTLDLKRGDMITFLRYLVQSFDSFAQSNNLQLKFVSGLDQFEMDYDADKMQQIVSNLISNAIKFTPQNGEIYFSVETVKEADGEKLRCKIRDTGQGISPEELPNLFERYYQAESSKSKGQGTGIGLALTRELVQLMGGNIEVESELLKGTTFRFTLPVTRKAPIHEKNNFSDADLNDANSLLLSQQGTTPANESPSVHHGELPQLLIVEDNTDIVYFLQTILESSYDITVAFNGEEGIEAAFETVPDIILCDVMMPVKDGFAVLDAVKNDARTSHVPIVMLTAKATTDDRIAGLRSGADAYLAKPFHKSELFAILKNMIQLRRRYQARYAGNLPARVKQDASPAEQVEDAFLIKIKELLEANISDEDFGIPQICRALGMSRTQLHRKLKALTGKSTSYFIRSVRMQKAKELLLSPDLNVSEVAYAVGYGDPAYFTNCFTDEFGKPPSHFQK